MLHQQQLSSYLKVFKWIQIPKLCCTSHICLLHVSFTIHPRYSLRFLPGNPFRLCFSKTRPPIPFFTPDKSSFDCLSSLSLISLVLLELGLLRDQLLDLKRKQCKPVFISTSHASCCKPRDFYRVHNWLFIWTPEDNFVAHRNFWIASKTCLWIEIRSNFESRGLIKVYWWGEGEENISFPGWWCFVSRLCICLHKLAGGSLQNL